MKLKRHLTFVGLSLSNHVTAIDGMQLNAEILYHFLIIHLLSSELDKTSIREWKKREYDSELLSTLGEFIDFLKNKVDLLQS